MICRRSMWVVALAVIGAVGASSARAQAGPEAGARTVEVRAPDGTPIVVDLHDGPGEGRVVVLFHQGGGSARGEYDFLVPRLVEMGFDVVAADLHGGGDIFGAPNRTLRRTPEPEGFSYCDARPQLDAVVARARAWRPDAALVLWGSSYSGALVLRAAAADPGAFDRVLAFSPASGGPMADCSANEVAGSLPLPVLVVRPEREAAIPSVREQLRAFAEAGHQTHVATPGVHGSSTLNPGRVEGDVAPTWSVVEAFLAEGSRE